MGIQFLEKIAQREAGDDFGRGRSYTETYKVITDDVNEPLDNVRKASFGGLSIPRKNEPFPDDPSSRVSDVRPNQTGDPYIWDVVVNYAQSTPTESFRDNPLEEPTQFEFATEFEQVGIVKDATGKLVLNAAGQPYDPAPVVLRSYIVANVTRNEAKPFDVNILNFVNSVNSDQYGPAMLQRALHSFMAQIAVVADNSAGRDFVRVRYEIHIREEGWNLSLVELGWNWLWVNPQGQQEWVEFRDKANNPLPNQQLLAADGSPLPADADKIITEYQPYRRMPWSSLGLYS